MRDRDILAWLLLPAMIVIFAALAFLQYRWTRQAGEAEQEEIGHQMVTDSRQFQATLTRRLTDVCSTMRIPAGHSLAQLRETLTAHTKDLRNRGGISSQLVRSVSLAYPDGTGGWNLEHRVSGNFYPVAWPSAWSEIARAFAQESDPLRVPHPSTVEGSCLFDGEALVISVAIPFGDSPLREDGVPVASDVFGYVLIELDPTFLEVQLLPELMRQYFGLPDSDFRIAITRGRQLNNPVFRSASASRIKAITNADLVIDLFGAAPTPTPLVSTASTDYPAVRTNLLRSLSGVHSWFLVVQHPAGSLSVLGARLGRRNMFTGFGVLLLLAGNSILLIYSTYHTRQLARVRMNFVRDVSHQLRTPVTAVCMAAENLVDGVVTSPEQVRKYGLLLRQQGQRLSTVVERTLLFAARERRPLRLNIEPVPVYDLIHEAVMAERFLLEEAGIRPEIQMEPDLPPALADGSALQECLENILGNAAKYAASGKWIGITARLAPDSSNRIQITVEDRGPGIPLNEQRLIFQPFYRGRSALSTQAPGTGLGLTLVKQIVEAMGGGLSLQSETGHGSAFTVHLPIAVAAAEMPAEQMESVA